MSACTNCQHPVAVHTADGCEHGRLSSEPCECPLENHQPFIARRESAWCSACGCEWVMHGGQGKECRKCDYCDGFLGEGEERPDRCGAGCDTNSSLSCRRTSQFHDIHADGPMRWLGAMSDREGEGVIRCDRLEGYPGDHRGFINDKPPAYTFPNEIYYPATTPDGPSKTGGFDESLLAASAQVGGSHYTDMPLQPWTVIDAFGLGFYDGNALKYLLRAGRKGSRLEDLQKCRHYLDKLIELEGGGDA